MTGNPVIDALRLIARTSSVLPIPEGVGKFLLVTAHRRENFGPPLRKIAQALADLTMRHDDLSVIWPIHPNPTVRSEIGDRLGGVARVHLIEPVGYPEFVALMGAAHLILTDSGGVQEEAPALGKPVLVLRSETERPEAVEAGSALLIGTETGAIVRGRVALGRPGDLCPSCQGHQSLRRRPRLRADRRGPPRTVADAQRRRRRGNRGMELVAGGDGLAAGGATVKGTSPGFAVVEGAVKTNGAGGGFVANGAGGGGGVGKADGGLPARDFGQAIALGMPCWIIES